MDQGKREQRDSTRGCGGEEGAAGLFLGGGGGGDLGRGGGGPGYPPPWTWQTLIIALGCGPHATCRTIVAGPTKGPGPRQSKAEAQFRKEIQQTWTALDHRPPPMKPSPSPPCMALSNVFFESPKHQETGSRNGLEGQEFTLGQGGRLRLTYSQGRGSG